MNKRLNKISFTRSLHFDEKQMQEQNKAKKKKQIRNIIIKLVFELIKS